jgi:PKD repeat protein
MVVLIVCNHKSQPIINLCLIFLCHQQILFCTNQEYTFTNTSSFDIASNPIWEWSLNGSVVSSSKDLLTQFSTTSVQEIKLKASIPGCESESIQNVSTVLQGPAVDFNAANGCEESPVNFVNTSSGTVAGYTWDFGDGNQSSLVNPTNTFLSHGNFDVVLTATNAVRVREFKNKIGYHLLQTPNQFLHRSPTFLLFRLNQSI